MSRLIIARTSATFSPAGGVRVKCVDPSDARLLARERDEHDVARQRAPARRRAARAISRTVAVPDALSSAPRCGTWLSGASEWRPPRPR